MIENKRVDSHDIEWKRINMRSVAHLLGVEFIHDLYNRHEPRINSIRFRHTITSWKDGIVNSYAPLYEWDRLGEILSEQYYSLDPILIKYTRTLYSRKREDFHYFIKYLKSKPLNSLSNEQLASLLIHFQSIVLGELYVLNFVQVEHGLNIAVKKSLQDLTTDPEELERLFVNLIETEKPSASQKEKLQLSRVAKKWRILRKIGLYSEQKVKRDVLKHCDSYKYLYSAYGEEPAKFETFWSEFEKLLSAESVPPKPPFFTKLLSKHSQKLLDRLGSDRLKVLIPLLVQGGLFRDTNKALLGQSVRYRFEILDEIAFRKLESKENLNYYLLAEITDLLRHNKQIDSNLINTRRQHGVVFKRFEDFSTNTEGVPGFEVNKSQKTLRGQCASQGVCEGECKIVLTKEDGQKVRNGDIMIAVGTDFDLIEAMYRSAAVITEEGGILSHASIVCREINKPCCIGVKEATQLLKDGQKIRVDATKGEITILS